MSIAQDEADRTSERIKDVQGQLVAQGKVLGGTVPFGYKIEDKRIAFGDNIHIVKEAIDHYMLHRSAHATTRMINDKYGLNMTHTHLLRLFRSTILKGQYRGNLEYCPALITPEEWDRLQDTIKGNIKHASKKRAYLFSGLLVCPVCGRKMGGCYDGKRQYYRCGYRYYGQCDSKHNVNEKKLEAWLLDHIEEDFKVKVTMKPKEKKEDPKKYKDRLKRLNDMYLMGTISEDEYKEKSEVLLKQIAECSKKPPLKTEILTADWKEIYAKLDQEHKRAFWHGLIKQIVINKQFQVVDVVY